MSLAKGFVTFAEFFQTAYNATTSETFASSFKEYSKIGNREEMIKIAMNVPCIGNAKITESYKGKNDVRAAELYDKALKVVVNEHEEESRACILTKALFVASANSRSFLDALLDCAKHWYNSKAFVQCLKYCECMLALPASFYDKTAESASYFAERRQECIHLERECMKQLEITSPRINETDGRCNKIRRSSTESTLMGKRVAILPAIEGKRHATLENCSDAIALRSDEKRGRHLVATRNIKAGSVLIIDEPFSFATDEEALEWNCLHCHATLRSNNSVKIPCRHCETVSFCSEKCRREAWQTYHQYECTIFNFFYESNSNHSRRQVPHLLLAYRTTILGALSSKGAKEERDVPFLDDDFLRYHTANMNRECSKLTANEVYSSRDYRTVLDLETHCSRKEPDTNLVRTIEAIFLAKCFTFVLSKMDVLCSKETLVSLAVAMLHHLQAVNCNAYEIVENVRDETTRVWDPRYIGGAIYPTVSLVNHSCYPNVVRHSYPSGMVAVRTIRFIGKGTEILDCYGPHFLSEGRLTRREYLWKKYRFLCACVACTENWQHPLPETMNYKCRACSGTFDALISNKKDTQRTSCKQCPNCRAKIDWKKLGNQFRKSVEKRLNAITKMYEGQYMEALPLLLEHIHFIEKLLAEPNIEVIKTQQCIIQCYNQFGCTSQ